MKIRTLKARYQLNNQGIADFANDVYDDVRQALDNDKEPEKLIISVGGRYIETTLFAETYEEMISFLEEALKIENE
jgi:arginine decarboxylase-like protein